MFPSDVPVHRASVLARWVAHGSQYAAPERTYIYRGSGVDEMPDPTVEPKPKPKRKRKAKRKPKPPAQPRPVRYGEDKGRFPYHTPRRVYRPKPPPPPPAPPKIRPSPGWSAPTGADLESMLDQIGE